MYLEITPRGGRYWRMKYRFEGKEKRLALGVYPDVSLANARDKRDEARKLLANGVDPSAHKKAVKASQEAKENTFEVISREWHEKQREAWVEKHAAKVISRLERDVFPWIGATPIDEIEAPDLLAVARRIEDRGANETAHRAMQNCGQIFRYAIATGRAKRDPSADLRGALKPMKKEHFAATIEPKGVGEILRAIDCYEGSLVVRCALRLGPLVFVRPGELRHAQWSDIDLDAAEWRFRVTKTQTDHIVPLSRQAVEILREVQPLTGRGRYVFPSERTSQRPMSDNAVLAAMRRLGIGKEEMTGHGWRAVIAHGPRPKKNIRPATFGSRAPATCSAS